MWSPTGAFSTGRSATPSSSTPRSARRWGTRSAPETEGYRRTAADRGRGQAAPLRADGRGVESPTTAHRRGRLDAVIASLLFMGGLRRSEVAALCWADVTDARDGDGVLLTGRTSKTNQEGDAADVRYLKNGAPTDRVVGLSPLQIQRRFTAAARAAGIEARVTRTVAGSGSRPN